MHPRFTDRVEYRIEPVVDRAGIDAGEILVVSMNLWLVQDAREDAYIGPFLESLSDIQVKFIVHASLDDCNDVDSFKNV